MPRNLYNIFIKRTLKGIKYVSGFFIALGLFMAVSIFLAWGIKLNADTVDIFPESYNAGSANLNTWNAPENALKLDLDDRAITDEFNSKNSAFILNTEEHTGQKLPGEEKYSRSIEFSDFSIDNILKDLEGEILEKDIEITDMQLMASFAVLADSDAGGTLYFKASVNDKTVHKIAELSQDKYHSNSINEGYYTFSLEPLFSELNGRITLSDVENLKVFVTTEGDSAILPSVYIDALWLRLDYAQNYEPRHRPKVKLKKGVGVDAGKIAFSPGEEPRFTLSNPNLTLADLKGLAEKNEAKVVEDKFRVLTNKNIVFEMLEEEANIPAKAEVSAWLEPEGYISPFEKIKDIFDIESSTSSDSTTIPSSQQDDLEQVEVSTENTTVSPVSPDGVTGETEGTVELELTEELSDSADDVPAESDGSEEVWENSNKDSVNIDNQDNTDSSDTSVQNDQKTSEENSTSSNSTKQEEVPKIDAAGDEISWNFFNTKEAMAQSVQVQDLSFYLVNPRGERTPVNTNVSRYFEGAEEKFDITIEKPSNNFIPGKYTLEAELETAEAVIVLQQDFSWGVLAINFNRSIYTTEDIRAYVQMGVLDDMGHTICDAELELKLTAPSNKLSIFSTKDGTIQRSDTCAGDSVNPEPDYFAYYDLSASNTGIYSAELTAETDNGTHAITDSFEVADSVLFEVERIGPTRIYPLEPYEMKINIEANEDFNGQIKETVPGSFVIKSSNISEVIIVGKDKYLIWDVDIKKGDNLELFYEFDALNESPRFYLLGPLEIGGMFSEKRQWQVASDAVLPTLYPAGAEGDGTDSPDIEEENANPCDTGGINCTEKIDDLDPGDDAGGTADGDTTYNVNGGGIDNGGSATQYYNITNTPADFASMDTLNIDVIQRAPSIGGTQDDSLELLAQVWDSTESTALTGQSSICFWGSAACPESASYSAVNTVAFSNLNTTLGKTVWDNAKLALTWTYTKTKGSDSLRLRVTAVDLDGTYTQAVIPIDISGSSSVANATVAVAVNGTRQTETATTSAGPCPCSWTISGVAQPNSGDVITVWLDGEGDGTESTAVTLYSGTGNITGMQLDSNILSIGTTGGYADQSLSVTNLAQYDFDSGSDGGDEDVMHTSNSGVLDVEGSTNSYIDESIRVEAGDTLTIGGTETLDTHNVVIDGTLTSGGAGIFTISGSWDNNSVFQASSEIATFTSTATGETIDSTGASDFDFNEIIFNGSGGEWTINSALTINTDLTMTAGTLLGAQDVTVSGGDVTGNGDINLTGGTFTLDGAGNFGGDTAWDFNNLTFGTATSETTTTTGTGGITVTGTLSILSDQTLDAGSKTWILSGSGTPFSVAGTFTANASTFDYTGTGATNITATTYNNLESSATATVTHTLGTAASQAVTVNGNFTIGTGSDPQTVDIDNWDPNLVVVGDITINSLAELQASAVGIFEVGGSWTNAGTFTNNGGSITFNANTGTVNINSTGAALDDFNDIVFDDGGGPATFLLASDLDVNGNLTITGGILDVDGTNNYTINVAGNWTNNDTFEARSGLVVLDGLTSANLDTGCTAYNNCTNGNFFDLEINKTDGGDANDNITLSSTDLNTAGTITITDGELVQGSFNVQSEDATTSVSISSSGEWYNVSSGDLYLDGDFINNGATTFNANGVTCGDADDITITNISLTPDWDGTGTFSMKDITISNQNAIASITVESGTNAGGNTGNWTFSACSVTIQGNILQGDESTFIGNPPCDGGSGDTPVVSLRINGGTESTTTCDASTGQYSFSGLFPGTGDTISIYLNSNSTPKANLVLVATTADVLDADLYQDTVIIRDEADGTANIADMTDFDDDQDPTNMLYDADAGTPDTLTLNSGIELHIWNSDAFDPNGTVITQGAGDIHVDDSATMNIDDASSVVDGDVLVDGSATFDVQQDLSIAGGDITTSGTSAVVSYSGTPTVTISGTGSIGGGTTPSINFYNLVISGTQTMTSATDTDNNLTVDGAMDGSASITTLINGSITGTGTINMTGGEVEQRVSATNTFGTSSGANSWAFNNLTFSNGDGGGVGHNIITDTGGTGNIIVSGILRAGKSGDAAGDTTTLDAGARLWEVAGTGGDPFQILDSPAGALNAQNSTFEYTGNNGGGDTTVEDASFNNLTFTGAETYNPEGATSASGNLTINVNATLGGTQNITVNGDATGEGSIALTGGVFNQRVSADQNFGTSSSANTWAFNDLTFSNSHANSARTISAQAGGAGPVVVSGAMLISDSGDSNPTTLNAGDKTYELTNTNLQNPLDIDLAGGVLNAQTSTFVYSGDFDSGDVHIEDASYYNLTLGGPVVENYNPTEAAITASNDLLINLNATLIGTNNVIVNHNATGAGIINHTGGIFEQRVSAAATFGTTSSANSWTFNNLQMSNSSAADQTITAAAGGTGEIIVNSTFTIGPSGDTNGTTFDNETNDRILDINNITIAVRGLLSASSTASFTVSGNWINDGTLNEGTGTVEFDGTTSTSIDSGCTDKDTCTSENFYDVQINKTSGTDADDNITLSNWHLRVTNTLTITDGEIIQGDRDVRAEASSATTAITLASGVSAGWTNTSSGDLTLGGAFDLGDGSVLFQGEGESCGGADTILFRSTDGVTQRLWDISGGPSLSINDADVSDQSATGTITVFSGTDQGDNGANWVFQGCALTNVYSMRPDGDTGTINWGVVGSTCAGAHWCTVNDNIDDPDPASFSERIETGGNNNTNRFTTASPTDVQTATQVIPKAYTDAVGGNNNMRVQLAVFINGSQVGTTFNCPNSTGTATWCSGTAITGNWTQADIDTLEIALTSNKNGGGAADTLRVAATYVEVTYDQQGVRVLGNAYENETASALGACDNSTTMITAVSAATTYGPVSCDNVDGSFTITGVTQPSAGSPVVVYIDNVASTFGSALIRYGGDGNITGVELRRDRLTMRHDDTGPVVNTDFEAWDNVDDSDMVYDVNDTTNELTLENANKLMVLAGEDYTPGANVTTDPSNDGADTNIDGDILIESSASMNMGTNTLSVGGDFENQGSFTKGIGQTTIFSATATGHTITDGGSNFENITFNGLGGGWSFVDATILDGDITMTAGTLSGTSDITVAGGDITGSATINLTGGNVLLVDSDGTNNLGGGSYTFNNLTIGDGDGTPETAGLAGNINVTNTLTIATTDILDGNTHTITLSGTGTPFIINGTFTADQSTVDYTGAGATNITEATYYNLESSPAATATHTLGTAGSQTININNIFTIGNGIDPVTVDADNWDPTVDVTTEFIITSGSFYLASDSGIFRISQNFTNNGTFTNNSGEIIFYTSSASTLSGDGTVFYDFTSTTDNKTLLFTAGETFQTDGLLTLTGSSGNEIIVNSTDDDGTPTQWLINHQGTENISFTNIKNSGCDPLSTDIDALTTNGNINSGNNDSCWIFVPFEPRTQNWQWFDDENNETPTNALASENTAPSGTNNGEIFKLRFTIAETAGGGTNDIRYKIQYSTQSDFSSGVNDLDAIGSCASAWCYGDGIDTDDEPISTLVLSDSDTAGVHNETSGASTFDHPASAAVEMEFTIKQNSASTDTAYFFRAFDTKNNEAIPLNTGETYPSITTGGTTLSFSISGVSANTTTEGIVTTISTNSTAVPFGDLSFSADQRAAHQLDVTTNAGSGYSVYLYQRQSLLNHAGKTFNPHDGTNSFPLGWSSGCSTVTGCYGYHAGDDSLSGGSTRFSPNDTYARFSTSSEEVAFSSGPVTNELTDMVYRIEARNQQESGDYETQLVYIIVPVF